MGGQPYFLVEKVFLRNTLLYRDPRNSVNPELEEMGIRTFSRQLLEVFWTFSLLKLLKQIWLNVSKKGR